MHATAWLAVCSARAAKPSQPAAHGRWWAAQAGGDGSMALPGGVGQDGLTDDPYGVCTAQQRDAGEQHAGPTAGAAAGASRSHLAGGVAGAQPAGSSMTPRAQLALAVGARQLSSGQLMFGSVDVVGDDQHVGSHPREPPTLLTRQPAHDRPSKLILTPDDGLHPNHPQLAWRLTLVTLGVDTHADIRVAVSLVHLGGMLGAIQLLE